MEQFPEQEQEIKLRDYYRIILRHIKLILIIFVLVMAATVYYTIRAPRIYESSGKILLELNKQTDLFFTTGGFGRNDVNNQMEVIKSPSVMENAIAKIKRHPDAENFPILSDDNPQGSLAKNIEVSAERETDIIDITFKSTNPREAEAAVNAVMNSYQEESLKYTRAEVTSVREFLEKQLDITSKKLAISEEDLRAYKIANEVFALSEETKEMITNMVEFEAQLSSAQTELQIVEQKLNYLKSELTKLDQTLGDEMVSISSPVLEQLRNRLIENQSQLAILLTKKGYTENHPQLVALKTEIDNIKSQMKQEIDAILEVNKYSFNPLDRRQQLMTDIITAEVDYQTAKSKVDGLKTVVEEYSVRMSGLPDAELELARLERAKAINEQVYSMLITRYEEAKISEEGKLSNIRIISLASIPKSPVSPKVKMNILIGLLLGLGLGVGAAFLLESLNTKINNLSDVERYVKLSILGTIPDIPLDEKELAEIEERIQKEGDKAKLKELTTVQRQMIARLVPHYSPKSPIAEAYRTFRTNVVSLPSKVSGSSRVFLVTSSGPKEGKSTSSGNLAITLAQMNSKTLLVDCDMRRPMIHNLFMVSRDNGLSKFLTTDDTALSDIIKPSDVENLDIITSGHVPPNPSELLSSKKMDELIAKTRDEYDYVIIDSPPIIAVTDALILARKVDNLILVIRATVTEREIVEQAKILLKNIDVTPAGVVINGVEVKKYYSGYKYYYYYYYYYYSDDEKGAKKKKRKNRPRLSR
ncbi:MAG TPA: polysaccharide biosynthesis tyrosine autokinase [Candidatus Cloacimonetes bacterium]|nr:polysaccharide biosynthesis tyrosine autokinase [Candidatus Cloacimonadota bacterium]HEX38406.1 polysaccharide biosynthesis tyrosine autokinase [Candidatus Cloacimonadota bacterium]